jgi:5-methylcytosine-specific restriction endonuclease McrA
MSIHTRRKFLQQAFTKQNGLCFYCQLPMWEHGDAEFPRRHRLSVRSARQLKCTAEHLIAQQDGGGDTAENIVAACAWCNRRRHAGRPDAAPNPVTYKCRVAKRMALGKWHPASLVKCFK